MVSSVLLFASIGLATLVVGQCPYADPASLAARGDDGSRDHVTEFEVDDSEGYLSSDVGGPIEDQESLKAGERGPTLLEDFIFRQKITHFDHERVCCTASDENAAILTTHAGSRASCSCPWCWCIWNLYELR